MPQLVKKRRSGWAVLAAGAMVASLLAVGATPAAAIDEDSKPDHPATATACLGAALADHGFTDLGGLEAAVADINCLAYYGITTGRTADTFDPSSNVTRSQMALFLSRTADVMGVDLSEGDMDADFGDIAELGEDRQSAIAALARNGILADRGDMAFDPGGHITRAEMAVALVNLVDKVSDNVSRNKETGLIGFGAAGATVPNDRFDDAYASVSAPVNNAISVAYELGITTGTGDGTTFNPSGTVPRRNMASFIVRSLAHSNARPEGLTAQVADGTITVSVRDADFAPVVNQTVDAFKTAAAFESKAFKGDGTCSSRTTLVDGATKCEVDGADPLTLSDGNIALAQQDAEQIGKGLTVWIWAGDVGDKYGASTDAYELSVVPGDTPAPAADASKLSNDVAMGASRVHYGTTVTVTIQLTGGDDDENAGPGDQKIAYQVVTEVFAGDTPSGTANTLDTQDVEIGDDGSATFTVIVNDPDPRAGQANSNAVRYTVTGTTFEPDPNIVTIVYSDDAPVVAAVSVAVSPFQSAPGANTRTGSAATVTVGDQFGRPFKGAGIVMTSDNSSSVVPTKARITGGNGQVRIGYSYTGGASDEVLTATYTPVAGDAVTGTATAFWVTSTQAELLQAANVLSADMDDNQVVVDPPGGDVDPTSVNYDGNDFFTVDGTPSSIESFEEALGKALAAKAAAVAAGDTPDPLTLAWQSYVYDDPSDIASFTLVTE